MKKNEIYTLTITGTTSEGAGVARQDGVVVFIPDVIVGETVTARIVKTQKNIAYGKVEEILVPSPHRISPSCPSARQCGGCCYQHIAYEKQLEIKRQKVSDCLSRIGKISFPVKETLPSPEAFHYRNKVLIPVGRDKEGAVTAGFYAPRSHRILSADGCLIQHESADSVIACVKQWMEKCSVAPYDETTHTGCVRHIYFRMGLATGQIMAGVVANAKKLPREELLAARLMQIPNMVSVIHNINCKKNNVILGEETRILAGVPYLEDSILATDFRIGPLSFYQVNPYQTSRLYEVALNGLKLSKEDVLFDIYCGIGTIGLCAAKRVKRLIGIEIVPEAVQYAKENAAGNGITNAEFFTGKAEEKIFDLIERGDIPTAAILDPPRAGCDKQLLDAIIHLAPQKLCYVSCDPATLARDLAYLLEHSDYQLLSVQPVDMFPQTSHVETVALLTLSTAI